MESYIDSNRFPLNNFKRLNVSFAQPCDNLFYEFVCIIMTMGKVKLYVELDKVSRYSFTLPILQKQFLLKH